MLSKESQLVKEIYDAAKQKNTQTIKEILTEVESLDILINISAQYYCANIPRNRQVMHITPAALLAMENDQASVEFLMQFGASKYFIAYGYARKGFIDSVNQLISSNQAYVLLDIDKMCCLYYSYCGYRDFGLTQDDESFLFLLTFTNDQSLSNQLIYNYSIEQNPNSKIRFNLLKKSNYFKSLMLEYKLNYEQVNTWIKFPILVQWFLEGLQLVIEKKLPFDIFIMIGAYLAPTLSFLETHELFKQVFFHTYKTLLINDLNDYVTPFYDQKRHHKNRAMNFLDHCLSTKNISDLFTLLKKQDDLFKDNTPLSQNRFYDSTINFFYPTKQKHEQAYDSKKPDRFTDLVAQHTARLQNKLTY